MSREDGARVVITGMGAITPVGLTLAETWEGFISGRNGVATITLFDPRRLGVRIAAEAPNFDVTQHFGRKEARRMDRYSQFAVVAAREAAREAGLQLTEETSKRAGVMIGSGIGGITTTNQQYEVLFRRGPDRLSPFVVPMMLPNMGSGHVSIALNARGPNLAPTSACSSASDAIGLSAALLGRGDADVMIAGGSEAPICEMSVAGFHASRALSTRNDEPQKASRPFDRDRDGFVMGEGGGVLILERADHALRRDAPILAELGGYGSAGDAYHLTQPTEDGAGATRAMRAALRQAHVEPSETDYINAHGTSTPINDRVETLAIKEVFGESAYQIPISSTKSMVGHLMGAAGAIEAVACVKAITDGIIPPTINLDTPDPECDLDYVPQKARRKDVRVALSNSLGFGGHNVCLVFKRWEP